ncbi:hypothetical protein MPS_1775 [Mycobacterium pseudoshottsii JCM 15466]|nr:hypothetical protein MPSD_47520 [Mycobacterium pseudoshottsii JCM 15466]GAQ33690.1 hypothetical protein MPS_1775 [Mycobacterium pseudoshottsii JCM 15466]
MGQAGSVDPAVLAVWAAPAALVQAWARPAVTAVPAGSAVRREPAARAGR